MISTGFPVRSPYQLLRLKPNSLLIRAWIILTIFLLLGACSGLAQRAQGLSGIHSIHIEFSPDSRRIEETRARIDQQLAKTRLQVVNETASADAVLRLTSNVWATGTISASPRSNSTRATNYQGYLSAELIGKDNQTLWSYLVTPTHLRTEGFTDDLADQLVSRLITAIHSGMPNTAASRPAGSGSQAVLHAAGATLPAPLYQKWLESFARDQPGVNITYDAIGSEAGIEKLEAGKVNFAASDMPLAKDATPSGVPILHFPTVLGGVVPIYNLPGLDRTLNLTPQALAGIYSGAVRKWNDPLIRESNHSLHLPAAEIAVVHRSDGSGTTYVWTSFLSLASPQWKSQYGSGPRVEWPVGTGAAGNEGVAQLVSKTPNAIGYVELIYAIQHGLNYAAVKNPAGQFIKADLASITAAAAETSAAQDPDFRFSILNAAGKYAYPISTFTWLLVPTQISDPQKQAAIAAFLRWMLTTGQKQSESLGYAPLPRAIAARELDAVNRLK
jgi:phosphate transport system substrate-binding protein